MTQPTPPLAPLPRYTPNRVLIVLLIFPVLGLIAAFAVMNGSTPPNSADLYTPGYTANARIDYEAPNFQLTLLDGTPMQLTDYRGRVVFLNFWRTDCAPCRRELPAFQAFMENHSTPATPQTELVYSAPLVLAVNLGESPEQINAYFTENNLANIPVVLDPVGVARSLYGVMPLPTTFVIDAQGKVRGLKIGEMTLSDMTDYLAKAQ